MKLIHFSSLENNIDCKNFDNLILSWNLNDSEYSKKFEKKKIIYISKIWQKNKNLIKKKRNNLKKIILNQLYKKLNSLNKIEYSKKNWEIILEPWLSHYLESFFFRWLIIESLIKKNKNFKYVEIKKPKKIPEFDAIEFAEKNYNNDIFNHLVFQDILDFKKKFKKNKIILKKKLVLNEEIFFRNIKYNYLFILYEKLVEKICSNKLFILIRINKSDFINLCIKLFSLPFKGNFIFDRRNLIKIFKKKNFDKEKRAKINFKSKKIIEFDKYIFKRIKFDLPRAYLENFNDIKRVHENKMAKTKIIVTDTLHKYNTILKSWLASKKNSDKNFKIVTADHGGLHGNVNNFYDYDQSITKTNIKYKKKVSKNQISLPSLFLNKKKNYKKEIILIICHDTFKYPAYFYSGPICEEISFQFDQIKRLKEKLHFDLNKKIWLRPYTINQGWKLGKNFEKIVRKKKIIYSNIDFEKMKKNAKINIITYPKSAYLEALINGPTFLLFKRKYYADTSQNRQFMNILFKNKLAFESGEKLAIHLNNIEGNIQNWWQQKKIQNSIKIFLKNTNIYENNSTQEWANFFKKIKTEF